MLLSEKNYLGEGAKKIVFHHPTDPDLCVKIPKPGKDYDIKREIKYLIKHQNSLKFLAPYVESIKCNMGTGYLYKLVRDEDGTISKSMSDFIKQDQPDLEQLKSKIFAIYQQLVDSCAAVNDLGLDNFLIRKKLTGEYDVIVIDGFGNTDLIKICDYSKFFLVNKLNRKFKKLCGKLNISEDFLYS